jgi:hypothetical protein
VLRERLRSYEGELKALREQVALLQDSVKEQKRLVLQREAEKSEVEYQWGASKAMLAKSEGDNLALVVSDLVSSVSV